MIRPFNFQKQSVKFAGRFFSSDRQRGVARRDGCPRFPRQVLMRRCGHLSWERLWDVGWSPSTACNNVLDVAFWGRAVGPLTSLLSSRSELRFLGWEVQNNILVSFLFVVFLNLYVALIHKCLEKSILFLIFHTIFKC